MLSFNVFKSNFSEYCNFTPCLKSPWGTSYGLNKTISSPPLLPIKHLMAFGFSLILKIFEVSTTYFIFTINLCFRDLNSRPTLLTENGLITAKLSEAWCTISKHLKEENEAGKGYGIWPMEFKREPRTNELTINYILGLALNSYLRCIKYFFTLL